MEARYTQLVPKVILASDCFGMVWVCMVPFQDVLRQQEPKRDGEMGRKGERRERERERRGEMDEEREAKRERARTNSCCHHQGGREERGEREREKVPTTLIVIAEGGRERGRKNHHRRRTASTLNRPRIESFKIRFQNDRRSEVASECYIPNRRVEACQ